jgi:hypothetical protein
MSLNKFDQITQAQLRIGADLMENAAKAARACKTYMQQLQQRLAIGESIEPGILTFNPETLSVIHAVC